MNVYFRRYRLRPLKQLNRFSSLEEKEGVHLMAKTPGGNSFADYFPHPEFGDARPEEFLDKFRFQSKDYDKKVLHFLLHDHKLRAQAPRPFKNHQLWDGNQEVISPVIKYKLKSTSDKSFAPLLKQGIRVRLDANGIFTQASLQDWSKDLQARIEYLEDPTQDLNWEQINLPLARDFISGSPFQYYIYKPNCKFYPDTKSNVIFSSYMGSELGRWHTYCELLDKGDLRLVHGIHTPDLYEGQAKLFKGDFNQGFTPDMSVVKEMYKDLSSGPWSLLCSL